MSNKSYVTNEFYCMNCGEKNFPLARKRGKLHKEGHRKKLYCYHCKNTVNMIECRNIFEVEEFKKAFSAGVFKEEAKASIEYIKQEGGVV